MSKSFIYNLILTIVAIIVFIFIGASVYDAFTRSPVNRTAESADASSVSGQIEAAAPDATQPGQPTAASETPPEAQTRQQAESAYEQTNDPANADTTQRGANSGTSANDTSANSAPSDSAPANNEAPASSAPSSTTPAPAPAQPTTPATSSSPESAATTAPPNNANEATTSGNTAKPAVRSNPDLRAVIPPVPTAPPRAEGAAPPNTTSQDMYNATNSGSDNDSISDSFPAPVSDFPAPVSPGATGNAPGADSDEQRRLQQLRNQKEQLRRDLGF